MRESVTIPPVGPISIPASRASATLGSTPSPSTTMSAGKVRSPVTTADTRPSARVSNASTLVSVYSVDAEAADPVGDQRTHVGVEGRHRLDFGFDDGHMQTAPL